jgi:arylsulfatase A-like enzyme
MRALGYQTAAIGKMHFTPQRARHGFDEMILPEDYYREMAAQGFDLQPMRHGLGQNELYPGMATVSEAKTLTSWIAEQCVQYIRERRDPTVPFFLWCSFSKPHPPLDPPEPYYSMYRNAPIPAPFVGEWVDEMPAAMQRTQQQQAFDLVPPEIIREGRAAYYGLITQIDYNMGRVFAALQDRDLFGETMILYTSDHGEYLGDHNTGAKSYFHESSAHVPFVMRLPQSWENRQPNRPNGSLVTLADVLPTVVAAGGGSAEDVDGMNLIDLVQDETEPRDYLEGMSASRGEIAYAAITDRRWKYMYYPEGGAEQLFDLETDPHELRNLAGMSEHSGEHERMRDALIERHKARGSKLIADGTLLETPLRGDSLDERRNRSWPGYHTEFYHIDVRH